MTNEMIILQQAQRLAESGKIGYTGRTLTLETTDGDTIELRETEPIHTFARWKAMGYMVRKGEKAIAKFTIWKHVHKKKKADDEEAPESKMFLKQAAFFSMAQVEQVG